MEINLPTGLEIKEDANNLYLNCLVCALRVGVFQQQAEPERINKLAREHVTGETHLTVTRVVNSFRGLQPK